MGLLQSTPLAAFVAMVLATVLRGIAIRRNREDRPFAFFDAKDIQRSAVLAFAASTAALIGVSAITAKGSASHFSLIAAIMALLGAAVVIIAQIQMGRAWRIGARQGDLPLFVSHGLFRFRRNPIFVGMMLVGLAAVIGSGLWWAWAPLVVFIASCAVQVRIEEAHLEASFCALYRDFRTTVPRWLGFGGRK